MLHRLREEYRQALRTPLGLALYKPPSESAKLILELAELVQPPLIVTVGDFVTANLRRAGLEPDVAVVDWKTLRTPLMEDLSSLVSGRRVYRCANPPGSLTVEAVELVRSALAKASWCSKILVAVEGEEDLLALPALAFAPPRSFVIYGLWLGAAVVTFCHPLIEKGVRLFLKVAFDPPLSL